MNIIFQNPMVGGGRACLNTANFLPLLLFAASLSAAAQNSPIYGFTNFVGLPGTSGTADGTNTTARFYDPFGIGLDAGGNLYVADYMNHTLRKVTPAGVVTTLAGLAGTSGSADGTNSQARFSGLQGAESDGAGNIYVADTFNCTIRKVTPEGVVTTLAGLAGTRGSADGTNSQARFFYPRHLTVDNAGYIYVADFYNDTIRKLSPSGVVTTLAGLAGSSGTADGTNGTARFFHPSGVAVDANGNVYVAEEAGTTIRKITPDGVVTTLAGLAGVSGSVDGTNSTARFSSPYGVAVDTNGNVFVADGRNIIRKVTPAGVVTTIGGLAGTPGTADGTNSQARFQQTADLAVDKAGVVYVAEWTSHRITKGTPIYPPPPMIATSSPLPSGTTGAAYNQTLTATNGTTPYTWAITSGGLPANLGLSASGVISGTPNMATNANFTVQATGGNGAYSTKDFTLTIYALPAITTSSPLPSGATGLPYSQTLSGSGGITPYVWSVVSGSLPSGLSLSSDGVISGTPTTAATASFSVQMTANNGSSATRAFSLTINQGVPLTEDFEHAGAIPNGWTQEFVTGATAWIFKKGGNGSPANAHGGVYNALLFGSTVKTKLVMLMIDFGTSTAAQLTFWLDMKTYIINQDTMNVFYKTSPGGVWTLLASYSYCSSWTLKTIALPTPSRTYYLAFEGNALGGYGVCVDDVTVVAVEPPASPTITSSSALPSGMVGSAYSQTLTASGGIAPYVWSIASGALPSGLSLTSGGLISGTPDAATNASFVVQVTGNDSLFSTNRFSLTINPVPTANDSTYAFTNFVGLPGSTGSTDNTNSAARFSGPVGVTVDSAGNLFVGDWGNHTIRQVTPAGLVTTLAGSAGTSGTNDGTGSAARFTNPAGVAVQTNGNVYVADENRSTIRQVTAAGVVTTLAGRAGSAGGFDGTGSEAWFYQPAGVAADSNGNIFVADTVNCTIRKVTPAGVVTTLAGLAYQDGNTDGTNDTARFRWPEGLAVDKAGNIFVADTANCTIRKVTPAGVVTTLAGSAGASGSVDGTNSAARFNFPAGIAVDSADNLFVTDKGSHTIRKVTATGRVTTIGGLAGVTGSTDEIGGAARFYSPAGLAVDNAGTLYIADSSNHRITKGTPLLPASGTLQMVTEAGSVVESAGSVTVLVSRTGNSSGSITCNYATENGSALAGSDYTATNGVLTWADGDTTSKAISVPILNDCTPEGSESFTVQLTGPAVGNPSRSTVTINDDDLVTRLLRLVGTLEFGDVLVNTTATREITLHNDGNSPLTVSSIVYPTGFSGPWSGIIPAGGSQTITVTFAPTETQPYGGLFLPQANATDFYNEVQTTGTGINPPTGSLQMLAGTASVNEAAGSVTVTVTRTGGSFGPLTCSYGTTDGSALAGSDYAAASGVLTWADGESSDKAITVLIIDDSLFENSEAFHVNLGGSAVEEPSSTTVTILDNDAPSAPAIRNFTPVSGAAGVSVTINGTNFYVVTAVRFGEVNATFTTNSSARLTAVVPATATNGLIAVVTPGGTALSSNTFLVLETFNCTTNAGTITITGYNGPGGAVTIPGTITGLPVTTIGPSAFRDCTSLTSVMLPNSVTSIMDRAFYGCTSLASITLGNSVASIGYYVFNYCSSLPRITIPASVTSLGYLAFYGCLNLNGVYFGGDAPDFASPFFGATNVIVYYLPATSGWSATFDGRRAVLWNPQAQTGDASFGVRTNRFGFSITGSSNLVIVVEACTNLATSVWAPVGTNTLNTFVGTNGSSYFRDPQWTNYPGRFYRLRSP